MMPMIKKFAIGCWQFIKRRWHEHDRASGAGSFYSYEDIVRLDRERTTDVREAL